jgi:hypothetical protein
MYLVVLLIYTTQAEINLSKKLPVKCSQFCLFKNQKFNAVIKKSPFHIISLFNNKRNRFLICDFMKSTRGLVMNKYTCIWIKKWV